MVQIKLGVWVGEQEAAITMDIDILLESNLWLAKGSVERGWGMWTEIENEAKIRIAWINSLK